MTRILALLMLLLSSAAALAFDPFGSAGIDQHPDAQIPMDVAFRDENGAQVTLAGIGGGKPILLAPVLHNCPNICGVTLGGLAQAVAAQSFRPGKDFTIIAFGIDPKEGPADARASLGALRHAQPELPATGVHALTGTAANVAAVTKALGYRYAWDDSIDQYAHVAAIALLTGEGHLGRWLYGVSPDPADLKLALTEAGQGQLGSWGDQILLLCYHYDPKTGRYGPVIWTAMRVAGGATAAAIIGLIALALMRERGTAKRGSS